MKKLFFISGLGVVAYSVWYFYKKQTELALDWEYEVKNVFFRELTTSKAIIECTLEVKNKSSFQVIVKDYLFDFYYQGVKIADAKSLNPITIPSKSSFQVNALGTIDFVAGKSILWDFVNNVIKRKPQKIDVQGYTDVEIMGVNRRVEIGKKSVTYSDDLMAELKIDKPVNKFLSKFGISI